MGSAQGHSPNRHIVSLDVPPPMRYTQPTMLNQESGDISAAPAKAARPEQNKPLQEPAGENGGVTRGRMKRVRMMGVSGRMGSFSKMGNVVGLCSIVCALLVFFVSQSGVLGQAKDDGETVAGFKIPDYDEEGNLKSVLTAGIAVFKPSQELIDIKQLQIDFYDKKTREVEMKVTAPKCLYSTGRKRAVSDEAVLIERDNLKVTGVGFEWSDSVDKKEFIVKSNARVELRNVNKSAVEGKGNDERK